MNIISPPKSIAKKIQNLFIALALGLGLTQSILWTLGFGQLSVPIAQASSILRPLHSSFDLTGSCLGGVGDVSVLINTIHLVH